MNLATLLQQASYKVKRRKPKPAPVRDSVMDYIMRNPRCTMPEIQQNTNTTDRSIASWLHRLHRDGMIQRTEYSTTRLGGRPRYLFWVTE